MTMPVFIAKELFKHETRITRLEWPRYSPGMNSIEHFWGNISQIGRRCITFAIECTYHDRQYENIIINKLDGLFNFL